MILFLAAAAAAAAAAACVRKKYAKDSKENADQLVALGVPIRPTVGDEYARGRSGGPTETRFDKVTRLVDRRNTQEGML